MTDKRGILRSKITLRAIAGLPNTDRARLWDSELKGFGIERRGDGLTYFVKLRLGSGRGARQRWFVIGRHGSPWTPDTARKAAINALAEARAGRDPGADKKSAAQGETVADLCALYMENVGRLLTRRGEPKKPSTIATDKSRIDAHILPLLGKRRVADLTREDIEGFLHRIADGASATRARKTKPRGVSRVRGGRGAATRTVGLLGSIMGYGVKLGLRSDNPVHGVTRFRDQRRLRRLSENELAALGMALATAQADLAATQGLRLSAVAARLLALTGWRRGEVVGLQWADLDLDRRTARLSDTKTGASVRPLSRLACDLIAELPRSGKFVFAARGGEKPMAGFPRHFELLRSAAKLPSDVTPHVLRHSFASTAADLGYSEATIAALLGHRGHTVTSRYTHSADAVLVSAADAVAAHVDMAMMGRRVAQVVTLDRRRRI